jgi:hypothetical protein
VNRKLVIGSGAAAVFVAGGIVTGALLLGGTASAEPTPVQTTDAPVSSTATPVTATETFEASTATPTPTHKETPVTDPTPVAPAQPSSSPTPGTPGTVTVPLPHPEVNGQDTNAGAPQEVTVPAPQTQLPPPPNPSLGSSPHG